MRTCSLSLLLSLECETVVPHACTGPAVKAKTTSGWRHGAQEDVGQTLPTFLMTCAMTLLEVDLRKQTQTSLRVMRCRKLLAGFASHKAFVESSSLFTKTR